MVELADGLRAVDVDPRGRTMFEADLSCPTRLRPDPIESVRQRVGTRRPETRRPETRRKLTGGNAARLDRV